MGHPRCLSFHGPLVKEGKGVLYIHGYGGSLEDPGLKAFLEGVSGSGFSVTCALLPITFSDMTSEIVRPIEDHIRENGIRHVIGFSLGGLVATYLVVEGKRVFISPFWGIGGLIGPMGLEGALAVASGPARVVLDRSGGRPRIGWEWTSDDHPADTELGTTAKAVENALMNMPPPSLGDIAIASGSDHIISLQAVKERVTGTVLLKGGHMLFSGSDGQKLIELVLASLKGNHP